MSEGGYRPFNSEPQYRICAGTFLGQVTARDYKPAHVIVTELAWYIGPNMDQCKALLKKHEDRTSISYAGPATSTHRAIIAQLGDLLFGP